MAPLTFVIPVRHPANAPDWVALSARLAQTARSIAAQSHADWRAVVVANHEAELPMLPVGFAVERVALPPNPLIDRGSAPREVVFDAVRLDKGRRVLAGMLAARNSRYFMVVDDDDLVSAELVAHVARNRGANGWRIDRGYLWTEGSRLLLEHEDCANICGTSFIVRADLYPLPERAELARVNYIKAMFGSHKSIDRLLREHDTPHAPLPFRGKIYRIGHAGAHSRSRGVLERYVLDRALMRTPRQWVRNVRRLRWVTAVVRNEFLQPRNEALRM